MKSATRILVISYESRSGPVSSLCLGTSKHWLVGKLRWVLLSCRFIHGKGTHRIGPEQVWTQRGNENFLLLFGIEQLSFRVQPLTDWTTLDNLYFNVLENYQIWVGSWLAEPLSGYENNHASLNALILDLREGKTVIRGLRNISQNGKPS